METRRVERVELGPRGSRPKSTEVENAEECLRGLMLAVRNTEIQMVDFSLPSERYKSDQQLHLSHESQNIADTFGLFSLNEIQDDILIYRAKDGKHRGWTQKDRDDWIENTKWGWGVTTMLLTSGRREKLMMMSVGIHGASKIIA